MSPRGDDDRQDEQPWHNRTSTLLGASIAALVAVVVLVMSVSWVTRQFDEPEQAPLDFVDPTYSAPSSGTSPGVTTTQTITSTRPPTTTDIDPGSGTPGTSTTPTTTSDTPPSSTTETSEDEEPTDDPFSSTRNRPRYNVTRTLYPGT